VATLTTNFLLVVCCIIIVWFCATATGASCCALSKISDPDFVSCCGGRILDRGQRLELLHKTQLEGIPGALAAFKGRLLSGVGPVLRLYELGKKKLLRKCEYRQLPQHVAQLHTLGSRIFVGDVQV